MLQENTTKQHQEKQPTDLNQLRDENLQLIYHDMSAKDKSFEVEIKNKGKNGVLIYDRYAFSRNEDLQLNQPEFFSISPEQIEIGLN